MADDNLATVPIRELITSFRRQIDELPEAWDKSPLRGFIDKLFLSTITNRFEAMADEIDGLRASNQTLAERVVELGGSIDSA